MPRERARSPLPWRALALLLLAAAAQGEVPVPPLATRVTDLTATLSADQRNTLEGRLAELESRKGSQVAVLLVPTVQPESIEQYATRVFDQWKLGRKGVDDGVLLVVAKNDRRLRIEVGYGLEGMLPDAIARRIIDESIAPHFRKGDFYGGVRSGVDRIVRVVEGEAMPAPKRVERPASDAPPSVRYENLLFYGFIAVVLVGGLLRSLFGRLLGAGLTGAAAGVIAYLLVSVTIAAIVAVVAFLLTLITRVEGSGGSGWSSGGSSGSSGGSGGFSGGGGSSGGGGASGRW